MAEELTDTQVALLCDIGECDPTKLVGKQQGNLARLLSGGYVIQVSPERGAALKLTAKGAEFLGQRGAGLNEA